MRASADSGVMAHEPGPVSESRPGMASPQTGCVYAAEALIRRLQGLLTADNLSPALALLLCFLLAPPIWGH